MTTTTIMITATIITTITSTIKAHRFGAMP